MTQQRLLFLPDRVIGDEDAMVEEFYFIVERLILPQRAFSADTVTGPEVDAYCALNYEGEVRNGGHAQFFGNSDGRMYIFETALAGLEAIGAAPQTEILREMITWVRTRPDEVSQLAHSPYRTESLDRLDDRFFRAQDVLSITTLTAEWIAKLPTLRILTEDEHLDYLRKAGLMS